jgi:hypothetical protein
MIGRATGNGMAALSLELGLEVRMMTNKVTSEISRIVSVEELESSTIDVSISMVRD